MGQPSILVTNDDGIDAPGLAALYEELRAVGEVTVVAPASNQSGVGRTRNASVTVDEHPWGYRVSGTPADCVAFALGGGADTEFDFVVAGVNDGPNIGNYVVGRSGTVGACIESAFLDVPALAVSAYHSREYHCYPASEYDFGYPARIARQVLAELPASLGPDLGFVNINAPVDRPDADIRLTELVADYGQRVEYDPAATKPYFVDADRTGADEANDETMDVDQNHDQEREFKGERVALIDRTWPHVEGYDSPLHDADAYRDYYPVASDRRALIEGDVSVTPLSVTHANVDAPRLVDAIDTLDTSST